MVSCCMDRDSTAPVRGDSFPLPVDPLPRQFLATVIALLVLTWLGSRILAPHPGEGPLPLAHAPLHGTPLASLFREGGGFVDCLLAAMLASLVPLLAVFALDRLTRPLWYPLFQLFRGPDSFVSRRQELLAASLGARAEGALLLELHPDGPGALSGPWALALAWLCLVGPCLSMDSLLTHPHSLSTLLPSLLPWLLPLIVLGATRASPMARGTLLLAYAAGSLTLARQFHTGQVFLGTDRGIPPEGSLVLVVGSFACLLLLTLRWLVLRREHALLLTVEGTQLATLDRWGGLALSPLEASDSLRWERRWDAVEVHLPGPSGTRSYLLGLAEWDQLLRQLQDLDRNPPELAEGPRRPSSSLLRSLAWMVLLSLVLGLALAHLAWLGEREETLRSTTIARLRATLPPESSPEGIRGAAERALRSLQENHPGDPRPSLRLAWFEARHGTLAGVHEALLSAKHQSLRSPPLQEPWRQLWERQIRDLGERLRAWREAALLPGSRWEPRGPARKHYQRALRAFTTPLWVHQPGQREGAWEDGETVYLGSASPPGREHLRRALELDATAPGLLLIARLLGLSGPFAEEIGKLSRHPHWGPALAALPEAGVRVGWSPEAEQALWWALLTSPPETGSEFLALLPDHQEAP